MGAEIKKERLKIPQALQSCSSSHTRKTALWYYNSTGFGKVKSDLSDWTDLSDKSDGRKIAR